MTEEIRKLKDDILRDYLDYRHTKNPELRNKILKNLKLFADSYHLGNFKKLNDIDEVEALNDFINFTKGAQLCINQFYSIL